MDFFSLAQLCFLTVLILIFVIRLIVVLASRRAGAVIFFQKKWPEMLGEFFLLGLIIILIIAQISIIFFASAGNLWGDFLWQQIVNNFLVKLFGTTLVFVGFTILLSGYQELRTSWWLGLNKKSEQQLVTKGIYRLSRNPMFLALDFYALGIFLINGQMIFLLLALILMLGLHWQIRQEEKFLFSKFGRQYQNYRAQVRRYL